MHRRAPTEELAIVLPLRTALQLIDTRVEQLANMCNRLLAHRGSEGPLCDVTVLRLCGVYIGDPECHRLLKLAAICRGKTIRRSGELIASPSTILAHERLVRAAITASCPLCTGGLAVFKEGQRVNTPVEQSGHRVDLFDSGACNRPCRHMTVLFHSLASVPHPQCHCILELVGVSGHVECGRCIRARNRIRARSRGASRGRRSRG